MIEADEPIDAAWIDAGEWTVEIADRELAVHGVAAAAVRPDQREDQALTMRDASRDRSSAAARA